MKIAFYSTKPFDRKYFDAANKHISHDICYYDLPLNKDTVHLSEKSDAVCAFVNDTLDDACIHALSQAGVQLIALRSAGFNHVDLKSCKHHQIKVDRVPAYSPYAVA